MGATMRKVKQKVDKVIEAINPLYGMPDIDEKVVVDGSFGPIRLVERSAWGAKKPKWRQRLNTPVNMYLIRYFTDTRPCENDIECFRNLQYMQKKHMEWGMPDIAYNFLIGESGTIYEGRGWTTKPTNQDWNYDQYDGNSIIIAVIGEYRDTWPNDNIKEAICRLMRTGGSLGHSTNSFDLDEIRKTYPWMYKEMIEKSNNVPGEKIFDDNEFDVKPLEQSLQK